MIRCKPLYTKWKLEMVKSHKYNEMLRDGSISLLTLTLTAGPDGHC